MSFLVTTPDGVTAAAGNLANIGTAVQEAATTASAPTTGIAAAAADEVSAAVSQLFGSFGQEFQAVSNQGRGVSCRVRAAAERQRGGIPRRRNRQCRADAGECTGPVAAQPRCASGVGGHRQRAGRSRRSGRRIRATNHQHRHEPPSCSAVPGRLTRSRCCDSSWPTNWGTPSRSRVSIASIRTCQPFAESAGRHRGRRPAGCGLHAAAFVQQFIATQIGFAQTLRSSLATTESAASSPGCRIRLDDCRWPSGRYWLAITAARYGAGQAFANLLVTGVGPRHGTGSPVYPRRL